MVLFIIYKVMKENMIPREKCHLCGYVTDRHLIHSGDGKIYCVPHYLLHVLNDEIIPSHKQKITNHDY